MKILHIITSLTYGGAQETLYNIIVNQQSSKIEHIVLSLRNFSVYGKSLKEKNIKCYELNINQNKINIIPKFFKLIKIIKAEHPALIQTWMYHSDFIGSIISYLTKTPIYWCLVNYSLEKNTTKLNTRIIAKLCSFLSYFIPLKIISCSRNASKLHIDIGYKNNIFKHIDLGIFLSKEKKNYNKKFIKNETFVLGCIGRWDPQKNHKNLIKAFNKIINEDNRKNFKLILAGPNINDKNIKLKNIIQSFNLENYIDLLDYVNDLDFFYNKIDLNILPSIGEAFPISLLESMVRKKIVICTNVGENLNIIRDRNLIIKSPGEDDIYNSILKTYKKYFDDVWFNNKKNELQEIVYENYNIYKTIDLFEKEWIKSQNY
jgi:glycosyltransferase involved in cell wall biosynthesis